MRDEGIRMKSPAHPGAFVRELIEGLDLTVKSAAEVLEVNRATLSDMVNQHANLSPEMALRLEKAFGVSMETLMRMQNAYDIAKARAKEGEITVKPYVAKPKEAPQSNVL
jgi:antitoxin HigA-1